MRAGRRGPRRSGRDVGVGELQREAIVLERHQAFEPGAGGRGRRGSQNPDGGRDRRVDREDRGCAVDGVELRRQQAVGAREGAERGRRVQAGDGHRTRDRHDHGHGGRGVARDDDDAARRDRRSRAAVSRRTPDIRPTEYSLSARGPRRWTIRRARSLRPESTRSPCGRCRRIRRATPRSPHCRRGRRRSTLAGRMPGSRHRSCSRPWPRRRTPIRSRRHRLRAPGRGAAPRHPAARRWRRSPARGPVLPRRRASAART